jgi:hypothetical protein
MPEGTLHNHCCENLRSYIAYNVSIFGCFIQGVQMKGIQNKIIISQKAFIYTFMGYTTTKGNYQSFFLNIYNFLSKFQCGLPWWHDKYPDDI